MSSLHRITLIYIFILNYCSLCYSDELPSSSPIFDYVLNNIDCGCNRTSNLNVSQVTIKLLNYETNASAVYDLYDAAEAIKNRCDFDTTQPINLLVPGFQEAETEDMMCHSSKATYNGRKPLLLILHHSAYTDGNVLQQADLVNLYKKAVYFTKSIGMACGEFLYKLTENVDKKLVNVMGHSLGAHMVGYIGEAFYKMSGIKLISIFGADPAGPCYTDCPNESFRSGQAETTVAFHCNSGEYGTTLYVSDYDFISDDGKTQDSCGIEVPELIITYFKAKCSHLKCVPIILNPDIYKNSIWQGKKCSSYNNYISGLCDNNETAQAGFGILPNATKGIYYFKPSYSLACDTAKYEVISN